MEKGKNICLELMLDPEHYEYERTARELVYRELAKQFPLKCSCGKSYHTEEQVIRETEHPGSADYPTCGLFHFLINCKCESTKALELGKENFNAYEIYQIQIAMKSLGEKALRLIDEEGEEVVKEAKDRVQGPIDPLEIETIKKSKLSQTECGKYIQAYIRPQKKVDSILSNPARFLVDQETQIDIGINLFRDRYIHWLKKRAE